MRKFKKYISIMLFSAMLSMTPLNVSAANENQATEESTEATTEATTEEDKNNGWKENKKNGTWIYKKDGENVTGWNKIDKVWYYFDGNGIMLANTNVGIYVLDENGKLTNGEKGKKFVPEPHGVIYNASTSFSLKDGHEEAENIVSSINSLYDSYHEGKTIEDDEIKEIRYLYNSLPMAEKARIDNETKLAELEINNGIVYDYESIYASNTDADFSDGDLRGNSYTFTIDDNTNAISVIVQYTSDLNLDGQGDIPDVKIISPDGEEIEVLKDNPQIRKTSINVSFTWTDRYLQMDIANAENGNWSINTSIDCGFSTKEYKGSQKNINPIPADDEPHSESDATVDEESEEEESNVPIGSIILGVISIGTIIGLAISMKKPSGKKKDNIQEEKKPLSKEEEYEILKKELEGMDNDLDEFEDYKKETEDKKQPNMIEKSTVFSQDEIAESIEDYNSQNNNENQITLENPVNITNNNVMDNNNITPNNKIDEWYEEEE